MNNSDKILDRKSLTEHFREVMPDLARGYEIYKAKEFDRRGARNYIEYIKENRA